MKTDVLVIGGGPCGITFVRKLKKLKPKTSIKMLRPEMHSLVYCAIPYAIEGLFEPSKVLKRDELVTDVGVELVRRAAVSVDLGSKRLTDDAGETHEADILLLATGASPIRPPLPGIEAPNVFTVKWQQDMEDLIDAINSGAKRAVVVGAGAIGIEQAQAYRARGLDVVLVDMADRALPNMLDLDMAKSVNAIFEKHGIETRFSKRVQQLELSDGRVDGVILAGGERIDIDPKTDFVCFAVGMKPDVELFDNQGLEINRNGIVIDGRMRTNIPEIYAGGDCCDYVSAIDYRPILGKLATNAVPMGKIAARVMAGKDDEYTGFFNGAATCAFDLLVGSTGFTEELAKSRGFETIVGYGESTAFFPMMPGAGHLKVKVVADQHDLRIVGAQVLSSLPVADKIDLLTLAIQRRMTLKGLSKLSYSAQPWQSHLPALSAVVAACENALDNFAAKGHPFHYPDVLECV